MTLSKRSRVGIWTAAGVLTAALVVSATWTAVSLFMAIFPGAAFDQYSIRTWMNFPTSYSANRADETGAWPRIVLNDDGSATVTNLRFGDVGTVDGKTCVTVAGDPYSGEATWTPFRQGWVLIEPPAGETAIGGGWYRFDIDWTEAASRDCATQESFRFTGDSDNMKQR